MLRLLPPHSLSSCAELHHQLRSAPERTVNRSFTFLHLSLSCLFISRTTMARASHAMLAFVAFSCFVLAASATMEETTFENAQEKTYTTPSPAADPPTVACPPPPPPSPGSCSFWSKAHNSSLPSLLTFITPILDVFASGGGSSGIQAITSIFGSKTTLHQGLTNTGTDGYSALLRQGSAAVLNSYTVRGFPYQPVQVKSAFRGALVSQQAASVMATNFENANLGYGSQH